MISPQQARLIRDNPTLCVKALSRATGLSGKTIWKHRKIPAWKSRGIGIPFLTKPASAPYVYSVQCAGIGMIYGGNNFDKAIEAVDRVIFYKEHQ